MLRERDLHMILLTNDTGDFFLATVATFQAVFVDAIRSSDNPAQIQYNIVYETARAVLEMWVVSFLWGFRHLKLHVLQLT